MRRRFAVPAACVAATLFAASPAAAQGVPLEMRCQASEPLGTATLGYAGTFRASGIRATRVISSSSISLPATSTVPANSVKSGPGAPALTFVYGEDGALAFVRFNTAFAMRNSLRSATVRLLRGTVKLADMPLDAAKVQSIANGDSLWAELPLAEAGKIDGAVAILILDGKREVMRFTFQFDKKAAEQKRAQFATLAETGFARRPMVEGKIPEKLLAPGETGCKKF